MLSHILFWYVLVSIMYKVLKKYKAVCLFFQPSWADCVSQSSFEKQRGTGFEWSASHAHECHPGVCVPTDTKCHKSQQDTLGFVGETTPLKPKGTFSLQVGLQGPRQKAGVWWEFQVLFKLHVILSSCSVIIWPHFSKAPLHSSLGHGEKQQPQAVRLIYSSLVSFTASWCSLHCSKFFQLPCWVLARGNYNLPATNFDGPTSSSHSKVFQFFVLLAYTKLHSSKGTYVAMEIILGGALAFLLFVPQLMPTENRVG